MAQQVWVNASTSVVQIDSSQIISGNPAIVYLSTIYSPGTVITIRDIAGQASPNKSIIVSTTKNLHFLDGTQVSSYSITQPYGYLTVNPKTSTIWALMNTFAFPDQSAAALVNSITATNVTASTLYSYQALISTAAISSISTDIAYVRTNLSVGQSTLANDLYLRSTLTAIGGISTAATLFASTSVTTRSLIASSTIQTPFAQLQFSTGLALDIAGTTRTAGLISTIGPVYVGGLISTTSDLGVGGNALVAGQLRVGAHTFLQSSLSTVGSFTLGGAANLTSSLTVTDNALFLRHVSIASNMTIAGSLSVMSSIYVKGALSVDSGLRLYGLLSTASSINVGENVSIAGSLAVGGDIFFNDRLLDLNNLSVIVNLYVGNNISTYSSIAAGGSLQIAGSTLLVGPVSTASTLTVGSHLSTIGNLAAGGSVNFASTLTVRAALCTLSNLAVGGTLTVSSTTINAQGMSTFGAAAFFSSVQIQGGLSVFSSIAVSRDLDVQGTLSAKGFNLGGAALVNTLGVTQATAGWGVNISSSTLQQGLFSTIGNIDMGGRFSTPNYIATGSTLFASFANVQNNLSTLANTNVGGDLNVLGRTILGDTLTATRYANFNVGLSTTTNTNVGGNLNVLGGATVGGNFTATAAATFNTTTVTSGQATFNGSGNGVVIANSLSMTGVGASINAGTVTANFAAVSFPGGRSGFNVQGINDILAPGPAFFGATSTGQLVITSTLSTICDAAFYSSVQIQGSLSVFSSVTVRGILTADTIQLLKGAIVSTLGITSATAGWGLNISSSTLAYGLVSTTGSVNIGGALSTAGAQAVGGIFTVLGATLGTSATYVTNVTASNSLLTNAVIGSNTVTSLSVTGSNNVYTNSVTGSNSVLTNAVQASNTLTVGTGSITPANGYVLDVTGAIRTTGTPLVVNTQPKITLSNTNTNAYSIFTNPATAANAFIITKSDNATAAILIASGGNVGVNTNTPAFTFDVNGTAAATTMTSPTVLANLTTTSSIVVSNVISNANGSAAAPSYTFRTAPTVGTYTDGTGLGFATAGTARVYVASAGNVGIANTSPQVALDVTGAIRTSQTFQAANGTATAPSYTFTNAATAGLYTDGTGLGFVPRTGTLPAIYVHSAGRVGISNVNPGASYSLDVAGNGINTTSISINGVLFNPGSVGGIISTSQFLTSSIVVSTLTATKTSILTNTQTPQLWIAAGSNSTSPTRISFFTGTTGSAWTSYTPTQVGLPTNSGAVVQGIAYNGSVWAIVGGTGTAAFLYTSPNGTTWTSVANPGGTTFPTNYFNAVAWNGSYWLLLGNTATGTGASQRTILRADSSFTTFTSPPASPSATTGFLNGGNAAAWNGTMWVAVGSDTIVSSATTAQNIKYSYDGINWTNATSGGFTAGTSSQGFAILWNGLLWVAGGGQLNGVTERPLRYSYDGMNWFTPATGSFDVFLVNCRGLAWNGTVFVGVGRGGACPLLYSYDAITWIIPSGHFFNFNGYSVTWNGTVFVAGGAGSPVSSGSISSPDGITWTNAASGIGAADSIFAVGYSSNVTPDAVIGNTSFYNKQLQFLTSTNSVNMGSNFMTINNGLKVTTAGAVIMGGGVTVGSPISGIAGENPTLRVNGDIVASNTVQIGGYSYPTNTAVSGARIQWNRINTAAGNVEILAARGTRTTGAVTFYTGLTDATTATSSDLAFTITKTGCTAVGTMTATSFIGSLSGSANIANNLNTGNSYQVASLGIATAAVSVLTVNPTVIDNSGFSHSSAPLTVTIPTPTGITLNDQLPVAHFTRQGFGGQAYGARATFALSRWENSDVNSRTRLDIGLAHGFYDTVYPISIRSDSRVGINTTNPAHTLDVGGNINSSGTVSATTFTGSLSGNATTASSCSGNAATATRLNTGLAFVNDAWYQSVDSKSRFNFSANNTTFFGTGNTGLTSIDTLYQFKKSDGVANSFSIYGDGSIKAEGDITAFSDGRYKTNIVTINDALDKVRQMRGVYYHQEDNLVNRKVGVIAQEMEAIIPEVVMTDTSEDKKKSVAYGNLTAVLIEAVKTLAERLERLEEKLASGQ